MTRSLFRRAVLVNTSLVVCLAAVLGLEMLHAPAAAATAVKGPDSAPIINIGAAIYRQGILPSGGALQAQREPGMHIEGAGAACVNCHRRSGLGMMEGRKTIPPIAGRYLFHPRSNGDDLDLPF